MKIKIQILIIIISCPLLLLGQHLNYGGLQIPFDPCNPCGNNNYAYQAQDFFDEEDFISDFGPRYLSANSPYNWHAGIDYTVSIPGGDDEGFHIKAITGGRVQNIVVAQNGDLKYIIIDSPGTDNDFAPSYKLLSLAELKSYIQKHRHLPNIPSEDEVKEKGIDAGEMNALLLEKVEELTLYMIALEEEVRGLEKDE